MSLPVFIDPHLIWIRNFPSDFLATEIQQFIDVCLNHSTANVVSITKNNAALVRFTTTTEPQHYIRELHQRPVKDRLLSVTYAKKLSSNTSTSTTTSQASKSTIDVKQRFSEFLNKLYATNSIFEQPPPPHLRYVYPKANRDILDAISIALETTPKLYTQVCHLMNRMNLEPPFVVGAKNLEWPSASPSSSVKLNENYRAKLDLLDASTQTESDRLKDNLIGTDESELESDVEFNTKILNKKRHKSVKISNSKRIRLMLQSAQNGYANQLNGQAVGSVIEDAFEVNKGIFDRSIVIRAPTQLIPNEEPIGVVAGRIKVIETSVEQSVKINSSNTTSENVLDIRIPIDQMHSHPLFQNYKPGEPSNKLYIKNLAKNVDEDDLRDIYSKFIQSGQSLDVRVMKTGRMKGQAFVCFNDPYMDDESGYSSVAKALRETNGLIVKDKVMVVMFGKK